MSLGELFLIAVGLSADAFAVALCCGLTLQSSVIKNAIVVGLYFGFFQGFMPLFGYLVGTQFADSIISYDHWIAFFLLSFIGGKMILESTGSACPEDNSSREESSLKLNCMLPLAIATSIDALAAGVTFAFLEVDIISSVIFIGVTTFVLSMAGVKIGNIFGLKYKSKAELSGGIVLVLMGLKILMEHTGIINF